MGMKNSHAHAEQSEEYEKMATDHQNWFLFAPAQ